MEVEKDYASKGVAGAGLGTGIAGLALGVMNAAGGLGALALGNRNSVPTAPVMPAMQRMGRNALWLRLGRVQREHAREPV